jgi:hypothetical protein
MGLARAVPMSLECRLRLSLRCVSVFSDKARGFYGKATMQNGTVSRRQSLNRNQGKLDISGNGSIIMA